MKMWLTAVALVFFSGCSFAPEYRQPVQRLPDTWAMEGQGMRLERCWWERFGDPVLDRLVEKALERNRDIEQGLARVDGARAALGMARADLFPQFSATGSGTRSRSSAEASASYGAAQEMGMLERRLSRLDGGPAGQVSAPSRTAALWDGAVQAVWELDIWGRWRNAAAVARQALLSAEETQTALELSTAGQVCSAYFTLLEARARLDLSQRTLAVRQTYAALYEEKFAAGALAETDILSVRSQVESLRDSLAQVRSAREQAEAALLMLAGEDAREIFAGSVPEGRGLEAMPAVPALPAGLPSDLLARRPDVRAAESALRAAHFRVGSARAAFFPSISLTGALGVESTELGRLFSGASGTWNFGGALDLPLLTFGRNMGALRQSEASMREAAAAYSQTVQQAFRDVRGALAVQRAMAEGAESLGAAAKDMRRAAELARLRYAEGYAPYLEVLEAERTLYSVEMELAGRRAGRLAAIAQVCVALGGGW